MAVFVARCARLLGLLDNHAGRRDDDVAVHRGMSRWLASSVRYSPAVTKSTPIACCPRVAARAILDVEQVAVVLLVALHRHRAGRRRQRPCQAIELVLVGEVLAIGAGADQRLDDFLRIAAALHHVQVFLVGDHLVQKLLEIGAGDFGVRRRNPHHARLGRALDQIELEVALVLDVGFRLAALDAKQRRLGDVDVARSR
jgi:hypothetical protein